MRALDFFVIFLAYFIPGKGVFSPFTASKAYLSPWDYLVYHAIARNQLGRPTLIWTIIAAGTLAGAAMSLFWPFLMTWVSADYEGAILNRRLGTYNGMWSSAAIIGPLIGGVLVDMSTLGPIAVGVACLAICFALLCLAHDKSAGTAASVKPVNAPEMYFSRF